MTSTLQASTAIGMGAIPTEKGYAFRTWAPHAKAVFLTGSFNDWREDQFELAPEENGYWSIDVPTARAGDEYKFILVTEGGERLYRNDPYARQLTNSAGNAIIYADDFDWNDQSFRTPAWNEMVIYELHIGTFNAQPGEPGTFDSAIERLDHLQKLGVNAVELLPVNEFPGDYSWGYNVSYPYSVEESYGGPEGLKRFVRAAHERGIAVILDLVFNHFGPGDLDLWCFDGWCESGRGGIYFYNDWKSETPWGDTRPDYGREHVRNYLADNALMWLREFRVDGLRFDAVSYIRNVKGSEAEGDNLAEGMQLLRRINDAIAHEMPERITIAEDLHALDFVTDRTDDGGLGFSAQWDANFVHPVRSVILEMDDQKRDLHEVERALKSQYSGDPMRRVIYSESHDEVANGKARVAEEIAPGNVGDYYSRKRSALGVLLTLTAPGIPMLFQGQELLEDHFFCDADPLDWSRAEEFSGNRKLLRDLIRLRRNLNGNTRGLQGGHVLITHFDNAQKILAFLRWYDNPEEDGVLVIVNLMDQTRADYRLSVPISGRWHLLFNSDWQGYAEAFGDTDVYDVESDGHHATLTIPAYGGLIFGRS